MSEIAYTAKLKEIADKGPLFKDEKEYSQVNEVNSNSINMVAASIFESEEFQF